MRSRETILIIICIVWATIIIINTIIFFKKNKEIEKQYSNKLK
jgi:hypothetical protein